MLENIVQSDRPQMAT